MFRASVEHKFELGLVVRASWKNHVDWLCSDFKAWEKQSDYSFGFVPLTNCLMTYNLNGLGPVIDYPIKQHHAVKCTGLPNFFQGCVPVKSELNVEAWEDEFVGYWDRQLKDLVKFRFPLDFNRTSPLICEMKNHTSIIQYPMDVGKYLSEEKQQFLFHNFLSHIILLTIYDKRKTKL